MRAIRCCAINKRQPASGQAASRPAAARCATPRPHPSLCRCRLMWRSCCGSAPTGCPRSWSSWWSSCRRGTHRALAGLGAFYVIRLPCCGAELVCPPEAVLRGLPWVGPEDCPWRSMPCQPPAASPCSLLPAAVCPDADGGTHHLPQPHQRRRAQVGTARGIGLHCASRPVWISTLVTLATRGAAVEGAANHPTGVLPPACRLRRRTTAEEVQAVAQAGLDFIRNNVSINSIITGGASLGFAGRLGAFVGCCGRLLMRQH